MDDEKSVAAGAEEIDETDEEQYGYADYTSEDLLEQAQANFQAMIMATALFLHQKGVSLEEWGTFLGNKFALAWDDGRPWEAGEFMDSMLTNLRALGADVVTSTLGIDSAEAVTVGFPDMQLSEFFSIDPALTVQYNVAAKTVAAKVGLNWEWKRMRDRVHYTVTQIGE